jgi:hypothetical protein
MGVFRIGQRGDGGVWIGVAGEIVLVGLSFFQYYD